MPRGKLGFPRISGAGPFVKTEPEPIHSTETGVYSLIEIEELQRQTAEDTKIFLREILRVGRPYDAKFRYDKYSFSDIVVPNGFIPTLANYVDEDPDEIRTMIMEGDFPEDDLDALFAGPIDDTKMVADKVSNDVRRVNDIKDQIESKLEYWPPTFEQESSTLDGAHRTAALFHILGSDGQLYAWKLVNADEIGVV